MKTEQWNIRSKLKNQLYFWGIFRSTTSKCSPQLETKSYFFYRMKSMNINHHWSYSTQTEVLVFLITTTLSWYSIKLNSGPPHTEIQNIHENALVHSMHAVQCKKTVRFAAWEVEINCQHRQISTKIKSVDRSFTNLPLAQIIIILWYQMWTNVHDRSHGGVPEH